MFSIVTDTSANLDTALLQQRQISVIPFHYYLDGQEQACHELNAFDGPSYYAAMRAGHKASTSQIPPQEYIDFFRPMLERDEDILLVSMSSGISGAYSSACMAAHQLREEFPQRQIILVDTFSASLGEGLLVLRAADCRDRGMSLLDTANFLNELRYHMCQVFTVGDLKYLRAAGRLSNLASMLGIALHIKPLLKGNEEGKIVGFGKVIGREKSIRALAEQYEAYVQDAGAQTVGIVDLVAGDVLHDEHVFCAPLRERGRAVGVGDAVVEALELGDVVRLDREVELLLHGAPDLVEHGVKVERARKRRILESCAR